MTKPVVKCVHCGQDVFVAHTYSGASGTALFVVRCTCKPASLPDTSEYGELVDKARDALDELKERLVKGIKEAK